MTTKSMRNVIILAKTEVTPGVDPVPTPAANSILVRSTNPSPVNAEFVERTVVRGAKGQMGSLSVALHRMIEIEVELAGSGAAGTAPKWAPLLMACDFSQTLVASTTATYQPVSTGGSTCTIYGYVDTNLYKMTRCKGTVSFEMNAKQIPVMKFKFIGEYSTGTDVTQPTGMVYTGFIKPLTVGKTNTPTFTMLGHSPAMSALSLDIANGIIFRELVGGGGPFNPDRKPTGSATIELPDIAEANLGEIVRLNTETAMQIVHGTTAGNIIQIDVPKLQLTGAPTINNDSEVAMVGLQFSLNPNAGNDEIVIVAK